MATDIIRYRQRGGKVLKVIGLGSIHPYSILQGVGQAVKLMLSFWGLTLIITKTKIDSK